MKQTARKLACFQHPLYSCQNWRGITSFVSYFALLSPFLSLSASFIYRREKGSHIENIFFSFITAHSFPPKSAILKLMQPSHRTTESSSFFNVLQCVFTIFWCHPLWLHRELQAFQCRILLKLLLHRKVEWAVYGLSELFSADVHSQRKKQLSIPPSIP